MKYAALLRGVNVGKRKVLKDDLLDCFNDAGFRGVKTVAQTGNVVFEFNEVDVAQLGAKIEDTLTHHFGIKIFTLVYPIDYVRMAISDYPFTRHPERHAYVVLTDGAIADVLDGWAGSEVDEVAVAPVGIYWSVPKGMTLDSPFAKFLASKSIAPHTTTRNINTLEKVVAAAG